MLQRAGRWMADSTSCPWLPKPQAQVYGLIAGSGSWKAAGSSQEKLFFQLGSAWLRMRGSAGCSPGLCLAFPLVSDVPWEQVGAHQPPGIKSVLPAKGILQPGGRDDFLVAKPPAGNSPCARPPGALNPSSRWPGFWSRCQQHRRTGWESTIPIPCLPSYPIPQERGHPTAIRTAPCFAVGVVMSLLT